MRSLKTKTVAILQFSNLGFWEIYNGSSFSKSIFPFVLAESVFFLLKRKDFSTKIQIPTFKICWKSKFASVFPQSILPFWLAENGLFAQKAEAL